MQRGDTRTVLVIQPDVSSPLNRFQPWFDGEGLSTRTVRCFAGEPVPSTMEEDALVVLGGEMSSLDDGGHPWLADVRTLFRDATERGRPALGICLGAQVLAQAFGGEVAVGDRGPESGLVEVRWRPEAARDPLTSGLPDPFLSGGMHGDAVVALPDGATLLGSSEQYAVQAFQVGRTTWGVQFHPELSPELYRAWVASLDPSTEAGRRATDGVADVERRDAEVTEHTRELARRFAALVRQR